MPNIERPQNPFIHTDQPDWKARKPTAKRSYALQNYNSKDRDSLRPSPNFEGSQPLPLDTKSDSLREKVTLRTSSSQLPAVSTSINVARKAPPPIPKKPALLSNRQHSQESKVNGQGQSTSMPPSGGENAFDDGVKSSFPPPLQRNGRQATESDGPPLPPGSTDAIVPVLNGLMDDDNEGASGIPSLQPMRRRR